MSSGERTTVTAALPPRLVRPPLARVGHVPLADPPLTRAPGAAAGSAVNRVVPFTRNAPSAARAATPPSATGAALPLRLAAGLALTLPLLLSLGGSAPVADPRRRLLPMLAERKANVDQTFESLHDAVKALTPWPDNSGLRERLLIRVEQSHRQVRAEAGTQPAKAAQRLADVFAHLGLQPGVGSRLALAEEIIGRGAQVGAGAADLEEQAMTRRAEALERARQLFNERRRHLSVVGSADQLAQQVHRQSGLGALGVSEAMFKSLARVPDVVAGHDASGGRWSGGNGPDASRLARYYMLSINEPDPHWAQIMDDAVKAASRLLQATPDAPLPRVLEALVMTAKPRLGGLTPARGTTHADLFGEPRSQWRGVFLSGSYQRFRGLALDRLGTFGQPEEIIKVPHPYNTFHDFFHRYSLRLSYPIEAIRIELGRLSVDVWSDQSERHSNLRDVPDKQLQDLEYEATGVDAVPVVMRAASQVFQAALKSLQSPAEAPLRKDDQTLHRIVDLAAEVYWLLSNAWPYERGSACIADLATKVIFDHAGIDVPTFNPDDYPNMHALFSPVDRFKADYPGLFEREFRWLP